MKTRVSIIMLAMVMFFTATFAQVGFVTSMVHATGESNEKLHYYINTEHFLFLW